MKYICNEKGKENVIVKKSILFFTLLLWICLSCSCGESDFVGSWYKFTEIDDSKLVLTNDNSFSVDGIGGEYSLEGKNLVLITNYGESEVWTISEYNNKRALYDEKGDIWIKGYEEALNMWEKEVVEKHPSRVVDNAEILSQSEESQLIQYLDDIGLSTSCDVIIVTQKSIGGKNIRDYTDDFFDNNKYGIGSNNTGIILVVDMTDRIWGISTAGDAINIFTDEIQIEIMDKVSGYLSKELYYEGFDIFAKECENVILDSKKLQ